MADFKPDDKSAAIIKAIISPENIVIGTKQFKTRCIWHIRLARNVEFEPSVGRTFIQMSWQALVETLQSHNVGYLKIWS